MMWTHKTKYKGRTFLGNYEWNKAGKRIFKLKDARTGREIGPYTSWQDAKKDGWSKAPPPHPFFMAA